MFALPRRVLFGAAYYHEYMPCARLDTDMDLMQAAHFSVKSCLPRDLSALASTTPPLPEPQAAAASAKTTNTAAAEARIYAADAPIFASASSREG